MMTQQNRIALANGLVLVGLLVMVVMAVLPLLDLNLQWMRWAFAAGAAAVLVGRIVGIYRGPSLRIRRLHRILISSGILYCASALMMFLSRNTNDWIAFLLAGVVMQCYASWMIDREVKNGEKNSPKKL